MSDIKANPTLVLPEARKFPVLGRDRYKDCPQYVEWGKLDNAWAKRVHGGQSLERLAERGGLSPVEIVYNLERLTWGTKIDDNYALEAVKKIEWSEPDPQPTTKHDELVEETMDLINKRVAKGSFWSPYMLAKEIIALIRRDERQRCVEALKEIQQRANETKNGASGYHDTVFDIHAIAAKAIKELEL